MNTPATQRMETQSNWPVVMGVLGIVIGIGGILMWGCLSNGGMAMMLVFGDQLRELSGNTGGAAAINEVQVEVMTEWAPWVFAANGLVTIAAVVLLVAGIRLLRRRANSRATWMTWAVLRLAVAVPSAIVSYLMNRELLTRMEEAATAGPAPALGALMGIVSEFGWLGQAFTLIWVSAFPLFAIVWFSRGMVRTEVAGWRNAETPKRRNAEIGMTAGGE